MKWKAPLLALAALTLTCGCEKGGIFPLLSRRDVLEKCETKSSTWIRTTNDPTRTTQTEILVIGSEDPTQEVMPLLPRCFVRSVIDYDASTVMDAGDYTFDVTGNGTFNSHTTYTYPIRRVSVFSRPGASRKDNSDPVVHTLAMAYSGNKLLVTYDGVQHVYTNLYDVVSVADATTQAGAEEMYVLMNLPLYTSQVRIPGFGSARMTSYANTTAFFEAVSLGRMSVSVKSIVAPDTYLNYSGFEDMSGMFIDGLQQTHVNTAGTGPMEGTVTITMRDGPQDTDVYVRGTINYDGIRIVDGFPTSGNFVVETTTPSVTTHQVSYLFANQVDMRPWVPVATP